MQLGQTVRHILTAVRDSLSEYHNSVSSTFTAESEVLRVISPLAEGSDRLVVEQAMAVGYELQCPLPFLQQEYERDFRDSESDNGKSPAQIQMEEQSLQQFRQLLARATAKFELDGLRANEGEAYNAAGRIVMNQADILMVVWDGKKAEGSGGTLQTLREAVAYQIPVIWIDAAAPHAWQLLFAAKELPRINQESRCVPCPRSGDALNELDLLKQVVVRLVKPPAPDEKASPKARAKLDLREMFFRETKPERNWAWQWKLFRDLANMTWGNLPSFRLPKRKDFEEEMAADWPLDTSDLRGWVNHHLRQHYAWADKLADYYADKYRSSFVITYFLGAFAVFLALLCFAAGWNVPEYQNREALCTGAELATIGVIIFLIWRGNRSRWHERWMDYRLVAERVRQLRILTPVGGGRPFARLPAHLGTYGDPAETWMNWHVRAVEREIGLPTQQVNSALLKSYLDFLDGAVLSGPSGQINWHEENSKRLERIDQRLHVAGLCLFVLTALAGVVHFVPYLAEQAGFLKVALPEWLPSWLTLMCAVFPALGAALTAIRNQGEFMRVAKRSRAMAGRLEQIKKELDEFRNTQNEMTDERVVENAVKLAQLMVDEVLDWRVVFQDRPLVPPA